MSPIVIMLIQLAVRLVLWWIENRTDASKRPAAYEALKAAVEAAEAQKNDRPLRDLLKRLRGDAA